MGQGLGKNTPVVLSLGKGNYEALIARHGQWVRWRVAAKCPCVKAGTQQPDIHCKKCGGLGVTFSCQKTAEASETVMIRDESGIIELDGAYADFPLVKCYDSAGRTYNNAVKTGNFITLNEAIPPEKGAYLTAVMTENLVKTLEETEAASIGGGFYRVQGLRSSKTSIEGLSHTVPADIEAIGMITDEEGNVFSAKTLRQDCFLVEPLEKEAVNPHTGETEKRSIAPPATLTVKDLSYIPPFTFVLLNQNLSKSDAAVMQELNGDAILIFPYAYDVAADDVITVLSGTYTQKSVIAKKDAEYDVIPAYFVDCVVSCIGREREYEAGADFILAGTNYLKWLCADCPEDGEPYALAYKVFPTYRAVKSIPQLRTSENQRMPKKAVVKLYDTYGEARRVNEQS